MRERFVPRLALATVAGLIAVGSILVFATSASAQVDPYGGGQPTVLPTLITQGSEPEPPDVVLGNRITRDVGVLPLTGRDLTLFVVVAAGLIATGTLIVARVRRTKEDSA